jgi:hypothetical protein
MTPEQHNKWLGYSHLAYALLHSAMGIFFGALMAVMFTTMPSSPREQPPPPAFIAIMSAFFLITMVGWVVPSFIAAYALLKRRRWAKTAGIVAGVFAAAQLPIGTAVAVYTFWFAFAEPGRLLYDRPKELAGEHPNPSRFVNRAPPDWR